MQKFAVVFFPKFNLPDLNKFIQKYNADWYLIPPHITVVSPISDISDTQLIEHLDIVMKSVKSFPITLSGVCKSATGNHLFLQVTEGNGKIIQLRNKLYSGILSPFEEVNASFVPHITLGSFQTSGDKKFTQAYLEAKRLDLHFACDFDSITLIQGDGISPSKIVKIIKL